MAAVLHRLGDRAWAVASPRGRIAVPTALLGAATLALWALAAAGIALWRWPEAFVVVLLTVASYASFTVMHEAVHGSLAQTRGLNTVLGTIASVGMGPTASYTAYRLLHLEHHRHTNDPGLDPDIVSGRGPRWWLPLSWLTTDLYYYAFYLRSLHRRAIGDQVRVVAENALLLGGAAALVWFGHGREMLLYWFLPGRITTALLACLFNYLPHRPYAARAAEDPVRATTVYCPESRLVRWLAAGHNLHQVHHLFPGIPFYDYARVWREIGADLNAGPRVTSAAAAHADTVPARIDRSPA